MGGEGKGDEKMRVKIECICSICKGKEMEGPVVGPNEFEPRDWWIDKEDISIIGNDDYHHWGSLIAIVEA